MRVAIGFCVLTAAAAAGERNISRAEVPPPVLERVEKEHPQARLLGFAREDEDGRVQYEVQLVDGGRKLDLDFAPDGKLLASEETIALGESPEPVKKSLGASSWRAWTVVTVERISRPGSDVEYELHLRQGKKRVELVFTPDGKPIKTER
jgi:hypothetical protein